MHLSEALGSGEPALWLQTAPPPTGQHAHTRARTHTQPPKGGEARTARAETCSLPPGPQQLSAPGCDGEFHVSAWPGSHHQLFSQH